MTKDTVAPEFLSLTSQTFSKQHLKVIREKKYRVSDTNASRWDIKHWKEKGLLQKTKNSSGWALFNLIEIFWIIMIKELRNSNVSIGEIKSIKKYLSQKVTEQSLLELFVLFKIFNKENGMKLIFSKTNKDISLIRNDLLLLKQAFGKNLGVETHIDIDSLTKKLPAMDFIESTYLNDGSDLSSQKIIKVTILLNNGKAKEFSEKEIRDNFKNVEEGLRKVCTSQSYRSITLHRVDGKKFKILSNNI